MSKSKMKKPKKSVQQYWLACEVIAIDFIAHYFPEYQYEGDDWVGRDIGGVLCINDYFFDLDFMVKCLELNVSEEDMFDYYDYALEQHQQDKPATTLKNWLSFNKKSHG